MEQQSVLPAAEAVNVIRTAFGWPKVASPAYKPFPAWDACQSNGSALLANSCVSAFVPKNHSLDRKYAAASNFFYFFLADKCVDNADELLVLYFESLGSLIDSYCHEAR